MEVHDRDGKLEAVAELLRFRGFAVKVERGPPAVLPRGARRNGVAVQLERDGPCVRPASARACVNRPME